MICSATEKLVVIFVVTGSGRHKQNLVQLIFKFLKAKRTVVLGRGKTKAVIYQCLLPVLVTCIHGAYLWNGLMGLINNKEKIIPEIVQKSVRGLPRLQTGKMTGIVLNAGTESGFLHHFNIKVGTLRNSLGFYQLVLAFEIIYRSFNSSSMAIAAFWIAPQAQHNGMPGKYRYVQAGT